MQNRVADFQRFWCQQLATHDCDPGVYAIKYVCARLELNLEQRYWLCWLYAQTYNVASAWVIFNEFPDYENVCPRRLAEFDLANRGRLPYQKDQKWLRGHLAPMYESYAGVVGESQEAFWRVLEGDFAECWRQAMSVHKVGRYTAWMWLQVTNEVCGLGLVPPSLELDHDSSQMHRGGLCLALGWDEQAAKGYKFTKDELERLDVEGTEILHAVQARHSFDVVHADRFSMETALCAYRKLFRRDRGRYLGYYLDRWAEDILNTASKDWPGICWELLWECRDEGLPRELNRRTGVDKSLFGLYLDEGEFLPAGALRDRLNAAYSFP
jgi:hypothetical protein